MFSKVKNYISSLLRMSAVRQALKLVAVFLVLLVIAGISAIFLIKQEMDERIDAELTARLQQTAARIEANKPERIIEKFQEDQLEIFYPNQYSSFGGPFAKYLESSGFFEVRFRFGKDAWRLLVWPAHGGKLAVGTNLDDRDEVLEIVFKTFLIIISAISLITLAGGLFFGLKSQQRISDISYNLDLISAGDLSIRLNVSDKNDDFDQLSESINTTTQRLEILLRQTRDLTTNIAHDLKTPLTRLRGQLEKLQAEVNEPEALDKALDQADQMIEIFEALLRIARLETGQQKNQFAIVELKDLTQQIADIYEAVIEDSGREYKLELDSSAKIMGDKTLLIQLYANLIENSLKHTPEGTLISLCLNQNTLSLIDDGPGIPSTKYEEVLKPMYRLEESRTTAGYGLGLAMVKAIADLHSAELSFSQSNPTDNNQPGLAISLTFPQV